MKSIESSIVRDIKQCLGCKFCVPSCTLYEEWLSEGGAGKLRAAYYYFKDGVGDEERLRDILYACTTCAACQNTCERYSAAVEITKIIERIRRSLVERGIGPLPSQKRWNDYLEKEYNPYFEKHSDRLSWLPREIRKNLPLKAEYVYFVGCTSSYRQKEIARATVELLKNLDVNFTVKEDEWCCGSASLRTGQVDTVRRLAQHNANIFDKADAETIITSCAGCFRTFELDYKDLLNADFDLEVIHTIELVQNAIEKGELVFDKEINQRATYHDPCHLGRHMGIYEPPRKVLNKIPGIEFVEMQNIREDAKCCGAGGGFRSGFRDLSIGLSEKRVEEAEKTGAEILTSICPFCWRNLSDAINKRNSKLEVKDIIQIIAEIMKVKK